MTSIIYVCLIDSIPVYVGSAYDYRYESRQSEHIKNAYWLKSIDQHRIKFYSIDKCNDLERANLEHFYWSILETEGFELKNKRDPIKTYKPITKELARIGVETRRRNGTIGNGGKSRLGHKHQIETMRKSGTLDKFVKAMGSKEARTKAIETMRKKGNIGNGGKVAGKLNGPENIKATHTTEAIIERERVKKVNGTAGNSGKSQKGKLSIKHKLMNDERRAIMTEMNCSWKEACEIRRRRSVT